MFVDVARGFQNARVCGNAKVKSFFVDIYGNTQIYYNACGTNHAHISDNAVICDALISDNSYIHSNASLIVNEDICDDAYREFGNEDDYYLHEYYANCEGYYDNDAVELNARARWEYLLSNQILLFKNLIRM